MGTIRFDASQVDQLAVDLRGAPDRIQRRAPKVFEVGANKIKRGMKRVASGHSYLPDLARHVDYDRLGLLDYQIGFEKIGQGRLANIAAYGSINNAPIMDINLPLREELPSIISALGDVGQDSVLGDDL